ncbi:AAA family ATPase [Aquimarina gracilis]|uniref:AAA family ATPase n=1 Tax=Aquimarina gracilis TaxID=874422 RepID=A0ABU5ZW95_9FLAO|nr:AAA family ATPase [Aquimarina gracilis]MEB3346145.1 AAA family ATPase [Aquimarina gracilis]
MKILIFGASGSGTTTLGKELEKHTGFRHLDVDDYYWKPTKPPFIEKVPLDQRNANLIADLNKHKEAIVVGSMVSWGKYWERIFDFAVFMYLDPAIRIKRLEKREFDRYGESLYTDKQIQQNSLKFLEWAKKYDDPNFLGRSITIHNNWIKKFDCPVLRIDGGIELERKTEKVLNELKKYHK